MLLFVLAQNGRSYRHISQSIPKTRNLPQVCRIEAVMHAAFARDPC